MPTRKEILENLSESISELNERFDESIDVSDDLVVRMADMNHDLDTTLRNGSWEIRNSIIEGNLIGGIIGTIVRNRINEANENPFRKMGIRINHALHIILSAFNSGERNGYKATRRLLRAYDFSKAQANYILDLLLYKTDVLQEYEENGYDYIMINFNSGTLQELNRNYERGNCPDIVFSSPIQNEDEDDEEYEDEDEDDDEYEDEEE